MIECIARKAFFSEHPAARLYTAREHQWSYTNLAEDAPRYAEALRRRNWYDCLPYADSAAPPLDGFTAMAVAAETRKDYREHFPQSTLSFFEELGAPAIYFFAEYPLDWMAYDFRSFRTRRQLRRITGSRQFTGCFKTDAEGFRALFPLFLFTNIDNSRMLSLYAEGRDNPVAMFLCDDGNLHTSYPAKAMGGVLHAAAAAGMVTGDPFAVCGTHYTGKLPAF